MRERRTNTPKKNKPVMMLWSMSLVMWRKADRIEWSEIEVDLQGDRCFTIIPGFREGSGSDGKKRQLKKTVPDLNLLKKDFLTGPERGWSRRL